MTTPAARPRREAAAQQPKLKRKYQQEVLKRRISVLWLGNGPDAWFSGTIKDFSTVDGRHLIKYDDGDSKWHDLTREIATGTVRLEQAPKKPKPKPKQPKPMPPPPAAATAAGAAPPKHRPAAGPSRDRPAKRPRLKVRVKLPPDDLDGRDGDSDGGSEAGHSETAAASSLVLSSADAAGLAALALLGDDRTKATGEEDPPAQSSISHAPSHELRKFLSSHFGEGQARAGLTSCELGLVAAVVVLLHLDEQEGQVDPPPPGGGAAPL